MLDKLTKFFKNIFSDTISLMYIKNRDTIIYEV